MLSITKILIFPNATKDDNLSFLREVVDIIGRRAKIYIDYSFLSYKIKNVNYVDAKTVCDKVDMYLVLGGDGTLLTAAGKASSYDVPVLGINLGRLGFLAEVEMAEVKTCFDKLFSREFIIEERMMLSATVKKHNGGEICYHALNDIVVTKGANATLTDFDISICGEFVDDYKADGIIMATPTGSTAYSLSAGGPIVSPDIEAILVTPICPHKLYSRAMVVSGFDDILVKSRANEIFSSVILIDGQKKAELKEGDVLVVRKSERTTKLICFAEKGFYGRLRQKLMGKEFVN